MKTIEELEAELETVKRERDKWKSAADAHRARNTDLMFQLFEAQERARSVNIEPVLHENAQMRVTLNAVANLSKMAWEQGAEEMRLLLKSINDKVTR